MYIFSSMAEAQFDHLAVRSATMEYSSRVILQYFSIDDPSIVQRPAGIDEVKLFCFVAKQFKALVIEGVKIDYDRLKRLFPTTFTLI